jgi:hypothetical protein
LKNPIWREYHDFLIVNFSKTLHDDLSSAGFCSRYIQYFPRPAENFDWGDEKAVYLWQRVTHINVFLVKSLLGKYDFQKLHFHQAGDPGEENYPPTPECLPGKEISFSTWRETKEENLENITRAAIYIAPRHFEGIGLSFLEAMAMGRCVIAENNPTMNEYITHGETGLLYSRQASITPLGGPWDIRRMQKSAYEYIIRGYEEWEKNKFAILDWIRDEVKNDPARLALTARDEAWPGSADRPAIPARIKTGLRRIIPGPLWNFMRKYFNSFFGRGIHWEGWTYFILGIIPLCTILSGNGGSIRRIEILGLPVWELRREAF